MTIALLLIAIAANIGLSSQVSGSWWIACPVISFALGWALGDVIGTRS